MKKIGSIYQGKYKNYMNIFKLTII